MATQRRRANRSIGNKLNQLDTKVDKAMRGSVSPSVDSVGENALQENSVGPTAIMPAGVDSEAIAPGAVGTEGLGIVNSVVSDSILDLKFADGLRFTGNSPSGYLPFSPFSTGSSGSHTQLVLEYLPTGQVVPSFYSSVPVGVVIPWAGLPGNVPNGWLSCTGQEVSRTDVVGQTRTAPLFKVLGTRFGVGNGTTTFNLPDFRGRMAVGQDPSVLDFGIVGKTGGEKDVTLTIAQMPSHTHVQNVHSHTYNTNSANAVFSQGGGTGMDLRGTNNGTTSGVAATNQNTGGSGAHNNMPPYVVMTYIIKQ